MTEAEVARAVEAAARTISRDEVGHEEADPMIVAVDGVVDYLTRDLVDDRKERFFHLAAEVGCAARAVLYDRDLQGLSIVGAISGLVGRLWTVDSAAQVVRTSIDRSRGRFDPDRGPFAEGDAAVAVD